MTGAAALYGQVTIRQPGWRLEVLYDLSGWVVLRLSTRGVKMCAWGPADPKGLLAAAAPHADDETPAEARRRLRRLLEEVDRVVKELGGWRGCPPST